MGRVLDHIDEQAQAWIARQPMFLVATAPSATGHVNVSPKGLDSFRILSATEVAYLDITGSGAETIAHVQENRRITFMFMTFDGPPNILRLYGSGTVHLPGTAGFTGLRPIFPERRAVRSIITASLDRVQDSCGFGVPKMEFVEDRSGLDRWAGNRTDEEIVAYWARKNAVSIDGLPAIQNPEG